MLVGADISFINQEKKTNKQTNKTKVKTNNLKATTQKFKILSSYIMLLQVGKNS